MIFKSIVPIAFTGLRSSQNKKKYNNTFEAKALEVDTKAPNFNSSPVRFHFKPE